MGSELTDWDRDQSCCQIEIHPEFGSFLGAFLGTFNKKGKDLCHFKKFGSFSGAFLGAFDKYVEILCYFRELFQRFGSIRKLFGVFLTNFENSTEIMCYFLCYFLKTPEFGRSPEIREPATALNTTVPSVGYNTKSEVPEV